MYSRATAFGFSAMAPRQKPAKVAAGTPLAKRKRVPIDVVKKLEMVKERENDFTVSDIARGFGVPLSTVSTAGLVYHCRPSALSKKTPQPSRRWLPLLCLALVHR